MCVDKDYSTISTILGGSSLVDSTHGRVANVHIADSFLAENAQL